MGDIKKFFKKLKTDINFMKAGAGTTLNSPKPSTPDASSASYLPSPRPADQALVEKMASAALSRQAEKNAFFGPSSRQISREISREKSEFLEEMEKAEELKNRFTKELHLEASSILPQVLFHCPEIFGDAMIGTYAEIERAIDDYLAEAAVQNPHEVAALQIVRGIEKSKLPPTVNPLASDAPLLSDVKTKRRDNLTKILSNLINNPDEPKFRKLRLQNTIIADLVSIQGAQNYFKACGFELQSVPTADSSSSEDVFIIPDGQSVDIAQLKNMLDLMTRAIPIEAELYRNTRLFVAKSPNHMSLSMDQLPDDFFTHTKEDIRKMVQQQKQTIEESGMLLTKNLREKLRIKEFRFYRFVVIRVRFPNNLFLQGTFYASEKVQALYDWLTGCLESPVPEFQLFAPPGTVPIRDNRPSGKPSLLMELNERTATLAECGLAPCSLLSMQTANVARFPRELLDLVERL